MAEIKMAVQGITLAKALKVKNRLAGRLTKVQADIQAYNSVPEGQADQVNVLALMLEKEIDQLQDKLDHFNHDHQIEVDGRILELAS